MRRVLGGCCPMFTLAQVNARNSAAPAVTSTEPCHKYGEGYSRKSSSCKYDLMVCSASGSTESDDRMNSSISSMESEMVRLAVEASFNRSNSRRSVYLMQARTLAVPLVGWTLCGAAFIVIRMNSIVRTLLRIIIVLDKRMRPVCGY